MITLPFTTLIISGLFKIYCIIKLHTCLFFFDIINHITLFYSQLLHWASSNSAFESKSENSDPQLLPLLFLFELNQTKNFLRKICSNYIFPNTKRTKCICFAQIHIFFRILPYFVSVLVPFVCILCLVVWLLFVLASFFLFFSCIVKCESPIKIKVTLNDILLELVSTILGSFALLMSFYLWHNLLTVTEIRNLKIQVLSSYLVALSSFILLE